MRVSDEDLEVYAENYIHNNRKEKTGLDFHEYLFAMIKLNQVVERIDVKWQKPIIEKKNLQYYFHRIMELARIN